ncbi:hypothetical protein GQ55_9G026300 [Panicum hallii var. hallii]|uniref:Uncharacterized protein n=1 Tax=Panicum hallii var. hallii TaxID=1504633 RepID=A0A2T7BZ68_9POAL|nr:hypothetical protein GQ55_9G026300 [Panicum hallii var. hallii]
MPRGKSTRASHPPQIPLLRNEKVRDEIGGGAAVYSTIAPTDSYSIRMSASASRRDPHRLPRLHSPPMEMIVRATWKGNHIAAASHPLSLERDHRGRGVRHHGISQHKPEVHGRLQRHRSSMVGLLPGHTRSSPTSAARSSARSRRLMLSQCPDHVVMHEHNELM